ncbi:MAG: pectate lyase, partial [Candidatus Roizmanbacteria bacterium]|nr:pectate lyase [Candidatus Roizmanbacteria bacterium]
MKHILYCLIVAFFVLPVSDVFAQSSVPAFPGAEGFGAAAVGGRGGRVIKVTNLNDSGLGSLRQCAQVESGPRICVFTIGGTIELESDIDIVNPYLTIAGQSAQGGGITLKAANPNSIVHMQIRAPEVVIRYLRSRPGTREVNSRALSENNGKPTMAEAVRNVMLDHNSFSWAGDELTITWLATNNLTYQWNIASESLPRSALDGGVKGPSFGEDGGGYFSVHHNLIAHHTQRLPQVSASVGPVDMVNNVIYNPGVQGSVVKNGTHANYVKNYIKGGPNSTLNAYIHDGGAKGPAAGYYVEGNYMDNSV